MKSVTNITAVRDAYKNHNLPKYIKIEFTDSNISPITNEDLTEDSFKLIESLCEDGNFQFGGCNAAQLSFTVLNRTEDFKGKKIKCTISLKNPQYKGDFNTVSNYNRGDIVKYDGDYYQFFNDYEAPTVKVGTVNTVGSSSDILTRRTMTADEEGILTISGIDASVSYDEILSGESSEAKTPDELGEYCDILYSYYDTSDVDDLVLFQGKIDSARKQSDRNLIDIVAYDWMYYEGQKDITNWFYSESTGISNGYYAGVWDEQKSIANTYKKGDLVLFSFISSTGGVNYESTYYYRMKKRFTSSDNEGVRKRTPNLNPDYWQIIDGAGTNQLVTTTIQIIRNKLSEYLGFGQEMIDCPGSANRLPEDLMELVLFKSNERITPQMLYEEICQLNGCFGRVNPANNKMQYVFVSNQSYRKEDVTDIYDPDKCNYQDDTGGTKGNISIVDSNGNILAGSTNEESHKYNVDGFLLKGYFENVFYDNYVEFYNEISPSMSVIIRQADYIPTSLEFKGLPFLEVGDRVTFDTEDAGTTRTINTVILCRTLSGIVALTDTIEAKKE